MVWSIFEITFDQETFLGLHTSLIDLDVFFNIHILINHDTIDMLPNDPPTIIVTIQHVAKREEDYIRGYRSLQDSCKVAPLEVGAFVSIMDTDTILEPWCFAMEVVIDHCTIVHSSFPPQKTPTDHINLRSILPLLEVMCLKVSKFGRKVKVKLCTIL